MTESRESQVQQQAEMAPSPSAQAKPASRKALPAVPKFGAPASGGLQEPPAPAAQPASSARAAAAAAAASAAAKAAHLAPAQRERFIAEAAAKAHRDLQAQAQTPVHDAAPRQQTAQEVQQQQAGEARAARPASSYSPPDWAGIPEGIEYTLEVMKQGTSVEIRGVAVKDHYIFGRDPGSDFHLEHPSISRLHAVLQYKAEGDSFIYDCGSAHGTFMNKERLKPCKYAPIRVGDIIKFAQSTRLFVFGGPAELLPEEGPNREQRHQMAAAKAAETRRARDAKVAQAQMAAALQGGASWGMQEDADDEDVDEHNVDWRVYALSHKLTDKQQKTVDQIRRREQTIHNLRTETDRIRAKESGMQELSAGQVTTMARNERVIEKLAGSTASNDRPEEIDDLDEVVNESIAASLGSKRKAAEQHEGRRKRKRVDDDDDVDVDDETDEFYDRTGGAAKAKLKKQQAPAMDAATLYAQKVDQLFCLQTLQDQLQQERASLEQELQQEQQQAAQAAAPTQVAGEAEGGSGAGAAPNGDADADALDAFMGEVVEQLEQDKVAVLQRRIADVDGQIRQAAKYLAMADPDGYYRDGTAAAEAAKAQAARAAAAAAQQKEAARKRQRQQLAARMSSKQALPAEPEVEEVSHTPAAAAAGQAGGPAAAADQPGDQPMQGPAAAAASAAVSVEAIAATPAAVAQEPPDQAAQQQQAPQQGLDEEGGGLIRRKRPAGAERAEQARPPPGGLLSRRQLAAQLAAGKQPGAAGAPAAEGEDVAARLAADLAALTGASRPAVEDEGDGQNVRPWAPPRDQSGDGRTELNAKLGY